MPIPSILATQYFQLVAKRQFAEAERILERIKLKTEKTERNRGYLQALHGILLSNKTNNDNYTLLANISLNDKTALEKHRREFLKHTRNSLHAEYDRGFFSAWADFTRVLLKLENIPEPQTVHTETQYPSPEEPTESSPGAKVEEVTQLKSVQTSLDKSLNSDY
jgi:viroplasmin and RNaseH domain-containing protein